MTVTVAVVEYTDPWCSWAWGTEPKLRLLRWRYGDRLEWRTVMGDLVADRRLDRPDFDAERAAPKTAAYWEGPSAHRSTVARAPALDTAAERRGSASGQG